MSSKLDSVINGISKFPIFIISSPRSGSTMLFEHIRSVFPTVPAFSEPEFYTSELNEFLLCHRDNPRYIIKIHASNLFTPEFTPEATSYPADVRKYLAFSPDVYRIKIRRINLIKQIASTYIARARSTWSYYPGAITPQFNDNINISVNTIINTIKDVNRMNGGYNFIKAVDSVLYYEDIVNECIKVSNKTPLPPNYDELLITIENLYNQYYGPRP